MSEHTKEPWKQTSFAIYDTSDRMILQIGVSADRRFSTGEMEANARRIVACVNACEGISTEFMEKFSVTTFNDFKRMKDQRDALIEALELIKDGSTPAKFIAKLALDKVQK